MDKNWLLLIPFAFLLGYSIRSYKIYRFQNRGEELVRKSIINQLPSSAWHLLNNVTLKVGDGTTQIDHILVSRYGVFVIETKHYTGWIFGDAKSKQWNQVIYGTKHRFQNPLHQNYKHLKAVQELLDFLSPEQIIGVVVFTGDAEFKTPIPTGVHSIETMLSYLKSLNQEVITKNKMQFCVGRLECHRLALTQKTDVEHQENLSRR
jgi:restriction system protein